MAGPKPEMSPNGPTRLTLFELVAMMDKIMDFEIRNGCIGEVETQLDDVRRLVRDDRVGFAGTRHELDAVDRLWVSFLRLGLFDDLWHLVDTLNLPLRSEVRLIADFCRQEYQACQARGAAYRAAHAAGDIFVMGCIVWGPAYVDNFLQYNLRSMLSDGNLPALRRQGRIVFSIVTDAAGEARMRDHSLFARLTALADVEFTIVPAPVMGALTSGHLVHNFYILYGMLDHCSIFFAERASAHLFMIPVDCVVAEGSLANMANYRHEGYECCGGGNIVAETETFLPALDQRFAGDGPISISTGDLATLAAQHAHHYFVSQIIAAENSDFGKHPREIFWPVEGGVEIHSVFIHPLFTSVAGLARYRRKHYANIDYGMIPRMFSAPDAIKIIEDPRQAYVNNFTAAARKYETTGRSFAVEDFLRSHDYSYPVQKGLFPRGQKLPCLLSGWTACRDDVSAHVQEINAELLPP
ncbi:MAG: hypothetical protein U1E60_00945 [Reyranellaceae bacterium]